MTDDLHHLAGAYALDAVDHDERVAFEAHLDTCERCRTEVAEFRETAAMLNVATEAPSEGLRDEVMAEIAQTRQLPPVVTPDVTDLAARRLARRTRLAAMASVAAIALLVIGLVAWPRGDDVDASTARLAAVLTAPDVIVQQLEGADGTPVTVAWSASTGELAVVGRDVDELDDDLTYQLWMFDDADPVPSVLFTPDDDGTALAFGEVPGGPDGWAVSIEPAGGSTAPTGEIVFISDT